MLHGGSRSRVPAPAPRCPMPELRAARAGDSGLSEEALAPTLQEKIIRLLEKLFAWIISP